MANMKTLTVNGMTYTVDDPDAVSYGTQQELTEAQKQLARQNIGAASPEQVEKTLSGLTEKDLDMRGNGIYSAAWVGVSDEEQMEGFSIVPGAKEGEYEALPVGVAEFYETEVGGPVILRNIAPGMQKTDAVIKEQLDAAVGHEVYIYCNENTGGKIKCDTTYAELRQWLYNEEFVRAFLAYDADGTIHYAFTSTIYHNGEDLDIIFDFAGLGTVWLDHNNAWSWSDNDAVTKARLDATVKETIDKICPAIYESGAVVTCQPVEGYPLTVTAGADATQITRCGKNLIGFEDFSGITGTGANYSCQDGIFTRTFSSNLSSTWVLSTDCMAHMQKISIPPGTYVFSIEVVEKYFSNVNEKFNGVYAVVKLEDGSTVKLPENTPVTLTQKGTVTQFRVTTGEHKGGSYIKFTLQLEAGQVATPYEPYKTAETFALDEAVPALSGVNTVFADAGEVAVTGRANPVAIIEKLTKAVGL